MTARHIRVAIIVPAAGRGERLGSKTPKPLVRIAGVPLVVFTLRRILGIHPFAQLIVPVEPDAVDRTRRLLGRHRIKGAEVIAGGAVRAESVRNGFERVRDGIELVAIHDLARPFVTSADIAGLVSEATRSGAALLAQRAVATVKESDASGRRVLRTLDRNRIFLAQTPQVFKVGVLRRAYAKVGARFRDFTDEAGLVEAAGFRIHIVPGGAINFKITTPDDLRLARLVAASIPRC